jgi:hypothetical protein
MLKNGQDNRMSRIYRRRFVFGREGSSLLILKILSILSISSF